jgi:hypothetical protein
MEIRGHCEDLLGEEDLERYQELFNMDRFNYDREENRLSEWKAILKKIYPDDSEVGSSNHEGEIEHLDAVENDSKVMRERVISFHQLKAFSLYLKDKPAQSDAYHQFLVSIFFMVLACFLL